MPTPFEQTEILHAAVDALCSAAASEILSDEGADTDRIHKLINTLGGKNAFLRDSLKVFWNTFNSVVDELANEVTTPRRAEGAVLRACAELKKAANAAPPAPGEERDYQLEQDNGTADILRKNQAISNKLRLDLTARGFTVSLAPVLLLCGFDRRKLSQANVNFDNLNGYTVLNKQRVLGITYRFIIAQIEQQIADEDPELVKKFKRLKSIDSIDKRMKEAMDKFYAEAVETYLSRNSSMEVVGSPHAWNEARWYWLVPKGELRILRNCVFSSKSLFDKWGFAFSRRDVPTKPAHTPPAE